MDRPDARIDAVVDEVYELFLDLDADESQIDFPIVYTNAKAGWASLNPEQPGTDLQPLLELLLKHVPLAEQYDPDHPLQAHVTNLDASPYVGRIAICRVRNGTIRRGETVAWCRADGSIERVRITELYVTEALDRVDAEEAQAGEIISVAGIPEITIGETLADAEDPPRSRGSRGQISSSVTIGINDSPPVRERGRPPDRQPGRAPGSKALLSATSRCASPRPSARRCGRSRAAASSRWRSWSS